MNIVNNQIIEHLFSGANPLGYPSNTVADLRYPHTNLIPELVYKIITERKPTFWLEVGTMTGGSIKIAAQMADLLKHEMGIVCIDPFIGDRVMWMNDAERRKTGEYEFLALEKGRPTIFEKFVANMKYWHLTEKVTCIPVTSCVGMQIISEMHSIRKLEMLPDVIYLDAAHEVQETILELELAWNILKKGGLLFGDDWDWVTVREAVLTFCNRNNLKHPEMVKDQWLIYK